MTELRTDLQIDQELMTPRTIGGILPRGETPIVPKRSIAGRALVAVVAIMSFLASLTTGAVMLVRASAVEWQSDVSREVTIQVRPVDGKNIEDEVARAVAIAPLVAKITDSTVAASIMSSSPMPPAMVVCAMARIRTMKAR
jgi:cell division transport system permease protein